MVWISGTVAGARPRTASDARESASPRFRSKFQCSPLNSFAPEATSPNRTELIFARIGADSSLNLPLCSAALFHSRVRRDRYRQSSHAERNHARAPWKSRTKRMDNERGLGAK